MRGLVVVAITIGVYAAGADTPLPPPAIVSVRDFVPDQHILEQTASHYHWGKVEGIDAQGRLKVERADGQIFFFDVSKGKTTKA